MERSHAWAVVLVMWTIVVDSLDKVILPILIEKGADLPLRLTFAGAVGGLIAFGVVGLFIAPVVLAVTYAPISAWVQAGQAAQPE